MRRLIGGVALISFLSQSAGMASATTVGSPTSVDVAAWVAPLEAAVVSSALYADLTGSSDRYAAMHAPAPVIERPRETLDAATLMRKEHPLRPRPRIGVRQSLKLPPRSALDPHRTVLDPRAMRHSRITPMGFQGQKATGTVANALQPTGTLIASGASHPSGSLALKRDGGVKNAIAAGTGTGIEPWWTYEEDAIPGIGKAMANVGTGNLLVSAMDIDTPEQGIDLAFQRVYNSQSLHDAAGDDGGDPAIFGNRWTNNFDANIVYNANVNPATITVYDMNGAACAYTSSGNGTWIPCAGEHAQLAPVSNSGDCEYTWTKPNGTIYVFQSDGGSLGFCVVSQNLKGHLVEILSRNSNNYVTLAYSYASGQHSSEDVTQIVATHSDGQQLTMTFGLVGAYNELLSIERPDGAVLDYLYDTNGNLLEVDKPGNNSANTITNPPHYLPQGDVPETYSYSGNTSTMEEACGPRCTVAMWSSPGNPTDGSALLFNINSSSLQLAYWQVSGVLDFTPTDFTNTPLQSGPSTHFTAWDTTYFVYGAVQNSSCGNTTAGATTTCDLDGHATIWTTDANYRATQTQNWTGSAEALWILTSQTWDANNNITSTTDANAQTTDYGYDTGNSGNMVEMQLPSASDFTVNGQQKTLAPLSFYSYDSNHNVTAYCDPVWTYNAGKVWSNSPGNNLCTGGNGKFATFAFTYDQSNEPFGCLTTLTKPGGYATMVSHAGGSGCGNGLPSQTQGSQISQADGYNRTPTQNFYYTDGYGNLTGYDRGSGSGHTLDSWTLTYDSNNLNSSKTQNDPTITNAAITSYSCHYADGSLFYTETPSQWAADKNPACPGTNKLLQGGVIPPSNATAYYYDFDGDPVMIITNKGCSTSNPCSLPSEQTACANGQFNPIGTTCKYYDGLDRLVETIEPYDSRNFLINGQQIPYEFYSFRWMNRYIFDLSLSGGSANLSISDNTGSVSGVVAYGNLYKTQEYLPQNKTQALGQSVGQASWYDVRGTSFDGFDRVISKYELAYMTPGTPSAVSTNTYDCLGQENLLCATANAVGQVKHFAYDNIARLNQVSFSGTGPTANGRTYTFDPDGRAATVTQTGPNNLGTMGYAYDVDGNEVSVSEPSQEPDASLICYSYYGDGLREYLSVGLPTDTCSSIQYRQNPSNGISQPQLFSYSYWHDGMLKDQQVSWGTLQEPFSWTYKPSGRELTESDALNGQSVLLPPGGGGNTTIGQKTYSYDAYGRVNSLTLPEGFELSSYTYDVDDELVSYMVGGQGGITRNFTLNARGELLQDTLNSTLYAYAQGWTQSANGAQVGNGNGEVGETLNIQAPPSTLQFDARTNATTCTPDPQWAAEGQIKDWTYQYDAAGRQAGAGGDGTNSCQSPGLGSQTFDAENHLQTTSNIWSLTMGTGAPVASFGSVQWGQDGRYRADSLTIPDNPAQTDSVHWDGGSVLFTVTGGGTPTPLLYIGKLGVMYSDGDISISDRDQTGTQLANHAYTSTKPPGGGNDWFPGLSFGTVRNVYLSKSQHAVPIQLSVGSCNYTYNNQTYTCPGFLMTYPMTRADGYAMAGGLVQGARTYDPTSGQWLTPDASAGDANDPMSQKPFMWNNNNAVSYADLTGYDAIFQGNDGGAELMFEDSTLTGTVGSDLAPIGQAITKVTIPNGASSAPSGNSNAPSGIVIDPSLTAVTGQLNLYHYPIANSNGDPVKGSGYEDMEFIEPNQCPTGKPQCNTNGRFVPFSGTAIPDYVGLSKAPGPGVNGELIFFQTFDIRWQGNIYRLPDELVHETYVVNGNVTTNVFRIAPDPLGWE
jgi:YD repeat-containing protein